MSTITLEERVALLERELVALKRQLPTLTTVPWWEQIDGAFANLPAFKEAMALGRQYREAQRLPSDEDQDVSA